MIKKLKAFTFYTLAGANIATILLMLGAGYSDRLSPATFPMGAVAGLAFPVFIVLNFAFLVMWLLFKAKAAIIPILGFIVCYSPIRTYCPLNIGKEQPSDALKVLSYNVWYFAGWADRNHAENPILHYIREQNADIVCLQEAGYSEVGQGVVDSLLNPVYPYHDTIRSGRYDIMAIYSKFPIHSKEHIDYASVGNLSGAFKLLVGGEEVLVINNHLESIGLHSEDKTHFRNILNGHLETDTAGRATRLLVGKIAQAAKIRSHQADAVARYVAAHRHMPIILCGDFNDGPISYSRHTIAKDLTDCYVETANGPGISYHDNGFYVRIDNIMCSKHFEPYACRVDNHIKASDHYPITCYLKKHGKTAKSE